MRERATFKQRMYVLHLMVQRGVERALPKDLTKLEALYLIQKFERERGSSATAAKRVAGSNRRIRASQPRQTRGVAPHAGMVGSRRGANLRLVGGRDA